VAGDESEDEVEVVVEVEGGKGNGIEYPLENWIEDLTGDGIENRTGDGIENHTGNGIENLTENGIENLTGNGIENLTGNGIESPIVIVLLTGDSMGLQYVVGNPLATVPGAEYLLAMALVGHYVGHGIPTRQLAVDGNRTLMIMDAIETMLPKESNGSHRDRRERVIGLNLRNGEEAKEDEEGDEEEEKEVEQLVGENQESREHLG